MAARCCALSGLRLNHPKHYASATLALAARTSRLPRAQWLAMIIGFSLFELHR
jgi:hypothetical protein